MAMNPEITTAEAAHRAKMARKRTKTGCLTCRKRRIKCGEERPVCRNCIKSKRQCEGYSQRVTFRQPAFDSQQPGNQGSNVTYRAGPQPGPMIPYGHTYGSGIVDSGGYAGPQIESGSSFSSMRPDADHGMVNAHHLPSMQNHAPFPLISDYGTPVLPSYLNHQRPSYSNDFAASNGVYGPTRQLPSYDDQLVPPLVPGYEHVGDVRERPVTVLSKTESDTYTSPARSGAADHISPSSTLSSRTLPYNGTTVTEAREQIWLPSQHGSQPETFRTLKSQVLPATPIYAHSTAPVANPSQEPPLFPLSEFYDDQQHVPSSDSTNILLSSAAIEVQDDDYYDLDPDEDEEVALDAMAVSSLRSELKGNLHRVFQANNISMHSLQSRRYDTFLYEGILDHYRVEDAANPLKNPATARVFAHFIAVTGPCLSIFERHPRNTSVLFTSGEIPFSQQGLWTYTMPLAALTNHGLLHAMLALASLHIARLQNASDTPSRQHYVWACKRINHLLGPNSKRRHKTTTIAASMLLGFYEIFTADHRAWNLHLMGSKQLFLETDFTTLARRFRRLKRERSLRPPNDAYTELPPSFIQSQDEILDQIHDIDDGIVSRLVGSEVSYDDPDRARRQNLGIPMELDLGNFEILRDLYWWYLKQDAYQSIISGNPLLLEFGLWANCPPRAPIGRADAVYGSFDHLVLLLGRIADFASRDRRRKLRQIDANGGQWKPAPGMKMPGTPGGAQTSQQNTPLPTATSHTGPGSYFPSVPPSLPINQAIAPAPPPLPQFFGMSPAPRQNLQMPSAYIPANYQPAPPPESPYEEPDLKAATTSALEEYGRIRAALREFEDSLGEAFKPLDPEFQPPMDTSFGTALFYRSYDIGCLWALYYMAVIIAIRSHPHAHPAAHVAAAIMAQETAYQANEIGRINAGIVPGPPNQDLNPTLGAALCESCVPSFFAAIQYRTAPQRHATVTRIHNIALRTGWGSAELIANGCETSWVKAAAAGRGPPYTRILSTDQSDDPRLSRNRDHGSTSGTSDGKSTPDRSLVRTHADARLTWAVGVMGTEDDEHKT